MEPNNDVFPTLIVLCLIIDFFFVTVFQPYLQPRYNKVRSVNDIVALLLFVNNLIYSSSGQFPIHTASPAVIYIGLNVGMIVFYCYHLYRIVKLHRTDALIPVQTAGNDSHHRPDGRKHLELVEIKARKHTNIDPPSTSHGETATNNNGYQPVTTSPPPETSVEHSNHSLPIISENDSGDMPSPNTTNSHPPLVFTENPLVDNSGTSFEPPSPSAVE